MRFPRPGPGFRHGAWVTAAAFLWSSILAAAGLYPLWVIPFGMLGAIAGYSLPWAVADTIRLIKRRGSK